MASTSAVQHVFHLPELLEQILENLNLKDLLLSQRVARDFRRVVDGSIRLRRKLFLEPDWHSHERAFQGPREIHTHPGPRPENNRSLLRAFPTSFPSITLVTAHTFESEHRSWEVCISFPAEEAPASRPAVDYPEASWRRMYLCQPPCQSLYLTRRWKRSVQPAMIRDGGITMGEFVEEVSRQMPGSKERKWHESFISSDRDWHFEGSVCAGAVVV